MFQKLVQILQYKGTPIGTPRGAPCFKVTFLGECEKLFFEIFDSIEYKKVSDFFVNHAKISVLTEYLKNYNVR